MADRSARLTIRVLLDAANAAGGLRDLGNSTDSFGDKAKKLVAVGAAFAGVTAVIKASVEAASRLQQSMGGVEAVFKGSAAQIKTWGANAAQSVGLSQSAYQDLATLIGSQLKNAGTAMDQLAPKTDELIRQGADLAAMYGGTTAEAVGALSSALKGERDPIERYGISLNQAAIDAEIYAQGLDTSTSAAKQAATATATLALITKQSADAQGAAGREADSYASVMQRLGATWENALATIGTALLPALSGLGDAFTDMIPLVAAVVTPIAELLGWVLQLPGPILLVAASIGAWAIFGGTITSALGKFNAQVRTTTGSMAGFKSALGSIGSSLAGGLALAGISLVIMSIAQAFQRSAEAARTATEAYGPVVEAIVASKGAWSDAAAAAQNSAILTSDAFKGLIEAGFSADAAVKILLGTQEEWIKVQSDNSDATRNLTKDTSAAVDGMIDANGAAQGLADAQIAGAAAIAQQTGATQENTAAGKEAADAAAKLAEEQAKANIEAAKTAASQTAVKVALEGVKTEASAAGTAVDFFVLSMQQASGTSASIDQAAALMNATLRDTATAFKGAADDGGYSMSALTDWNVAALTATERGDAIYQSLLKQQTAYATSTTAAFANAGGNEDAAAGMSAAAAAADTAYAAFIAMATEATGSSVAAEQLAAKLGIVQGTQIDPKTFELIAADAQADQAVADLQAAQIAPKTVEVTAAVAPAQASLDYVSRGAYEATVTAGAETAGAEGKIDAVADAKYKATVQTDANVAPAASAVNAFTAQARDTTIQVQANVSPAQTAINGLIQQTRTAIVAVNANTSPFDSAMSAILNRSYTATINVTANTSAATSAIASVPRSVTVPPPPALMAAQRAAETFGAPSPPVGLTGPQIAYHAPPALSLHGLLPSSGTSVTYTVNLTGGITDPDGAARAIERVLSRRDRRSGAVIAR